MSRRSKNLTAKDVESIELMLDGWTGKLTWEFLGDAIEQELHQRYTRQALNKHRSIVTAFQVRKHSIKGSASSAPKVVASPELQAALDTIGRLEATIQRMKADRDAMLGMFGRWLMNARTRGVTENMLNQPLAPRLKRKRDVSGTE